MKKVGIIVISLFIVLAGCTSNSKKESSNTKTKNYCTLDCEVADMSGYGLSEKDHVFGSITFNQANTYFKDKDFSGIIYIGFDTCPWCLEAVPVMNEVAKDLGLSIYYVNKKDPQNQEHPEWVEKTTEILNDAYGLEVDENNKPVLYVPEVIVVKGGEIVSHHMGTLEDHDATKRKMTDSEKEELSTIYRDMFEELK